MGEKLLHAFMKEAAKLKVGLFLTVRKSNPAIRLYKRLGFQAVTESVFTNRVEGTSFAIKYKILIKSLP